MSKEITYICNLCHMSYEHKAAHGNVLAWYWGNSRKGNNQVYTLRADIGQVECGTHICRKCAIVLKEELSLIDLNERP